MAGKKIELDFAPYLAEFIATFVFVFIGAGSIVAASYFNNFDGVAIAAAHGFTIFIMAAATANVSGGHINPAVTWAMMWRGLFSKDFSLIKGFGYIMAQCAGAACGVGMLYSVTSFLDGGMVAADAVNFGTPGLTNGLESHGGFLLEMIFGFILVFVILRTAVQDKLSWAPFAIGMTVFVLALMGGPLTGAAMNPARWFGPAIISGTLDNALIYIFAPMSGAVIAVFANWLISRKHQSPE